MAGQFFEVVTVKPVLRDQCEITMQLFLHQVWGGPNHNQETMVPSSHPGSFGAIVINDWPIHDALDPNATVVAHARGMHVQVDQANTTWYTSMNIEFVDDRFNGSKLQVMGTTPEKGQWAIVGGTRELAMAYGTIDHNVVRTNPGIDVFRQLDIHAFYIPPQMAEYVHVTPTTAN
ncbi:hypothetical protein ABZP36_011509 [Zizania latifolia]